MFSVIQSDLFEHDHPALCHCVSADFAMGRGIAIQFKRRFGRKEDLIAQKRSVGQTAFLKTEHGQYVYYLVTKQRASGKPTYETLRKALEDMAMLMESHRVTNISMPRIGCGLDRLDWNNVQKIIEETLTSKGISVTIYVKD